MSPRRATGLLIAIFGLAFFAALVRHPDQTLYSDYSDLFTLHLPSKHFLIRSWRETGELPLWLPYNFAGMPFLHDIQVSAFYPLHWPLFVVPNEWLGAALSWFIVLHVVIAGWTMYALARYHGLGNAGSLVAAIGYMFAGKWLLHILAGGHYNMVPLAWLPLTELWLERAIREQSLARATLAGAVFSFFVLCAYPYVTLYAGLFIAIWTWGTARDASHGSAGALRLWLGYGAWTALVAVALGAVQLLPGLEASEYASRSAGVGITRQTLMNAIQSLAGLVGPPLSDEPNIWENRAGLGILWLVLAVLAPILANDRRTRFQAGVCLALVAFVFGGSVLFQSLPGFRLFRLPSRMLLVAALPIALLVGKSVQALLSLDLSEEELRRCRTVLVKFTVVVLFLAVVMGIAIVAGRSDIHVRWHPYWATLGITIPVAYWLLRPQTALGTFLRATVWVLILGVDVCSLTWPLVAVRLEAEIFTPSASVQYLMGQRDRHGRALDFNPDDTSANHTPLWPGLPAMCGVEPIRGFNPIDVLRYKEYLQFITDADEPLHAIDGMFTGPILGTFVIENQSLANLLGIRYILQPSTWPLAKTVRDKGGQSNWTKVMEDPTPTTFNFISVRPGGRDCGVQSLPPYTIYENRAALPRAFVVPEAAPLPQRSEVLAALKGTDFRRRVFLEGYEEKKSNTHTIGPSDVAIRHYTPNRIALEITPGDGGFLVLTDVWFPGWTCQVDGRPTPVYRADFLFRGIELPAGAHEVVFTFAPTSYAWSKAISVSALLLILIIIGAPLLRRRRVTALAEPERMADAVAR